MKRLNKPRTVKVGGHVLKIKIIKKADFLGEHDRDKGEIRLSGDVASSQQATALLHELLHACFAESGLRAKHPEIEEEIVASLEALLYAVLRDNPKVIQFIQEAE